MMKVKKMFHRERTQRTQGECWAGVVTGGRGPAGQVRRRRGSGDAGTASKRRGITRLPGRGAPLYRAAVNAGAASVRVARSALRDGRDGKQASLYHAVAWTQASLYRAAGGHMGWPWVASLYHMGSRSGVEARSAGTTGRRRGSSEEGQRRRDITHPIGVISFVACRAHHRGAALPKSPSTISTDRP